MSLLSRALGVLRSDPRPDVVAGPPLPAGLQFGLDGVADGLLKGWVHDPHAVGPSTVELVVEDGPVLTVLADRRRNDVARAGHGDGRCGFLLPVPDELVGQTRQVVLRLPDGTELRRREVTFMPPRATEAGFWCDAPWLDRPDAEDEARRRTEAGTLARGDAERLLAFAREGYCVLPGVVSPRLTAALTHHVERCWADRAHVSARWPQGEGQGWLDALRDEEAADVRRQSYRLSNLLNTSEAALEVSCHPEVVRLVGLILGGRPIATQSLTFEHGTQQAEHMDFAFVHQENPASLVGAWVALEDVDDEAGPLFYYPRSHREVPFYDWGGGSILSYGQDQKGRSFSRYLEEEARLRGLQKTPFLARRGDVILWHSALVHGGLPRKPGGGTRWSHVTHYTLADACPRDRRTPKVPPVGRTRNGCDYHAWQKAGHVEGRYRLA